MAIRKPTPPAAKSAAMADILTQAGQESKFKGGSLVEGTISAIKGGIGLHTTGITKRRFLPNLQTVRATDGKGNTKRICVCTRCLKSGKVTKA
jgi:large subunit ribosomal protein L28